MVDAGVPSRSPAQGSVHPRAQLGYSSSVRGYGITAQSGELDDRARTEVVTAVRALSDFGVVIPEFPTPEQVAAVPARLVYAQLTSGQASPVWWHTVPAGRDESGRPGNVFVHIVVGDETTCSLRPIEVWEAPWWVRPFGPAAVAAATLPTGPLPSGGRLDRQAAVDFLLDPDEWRVETVGVLLDAVVATTTHADWRGRTLVLGVADTQEAACWVAAMSFLLPPEIAARWHWSLRERPSDVARARERGLDLVCVPLQDLHVVDHDGAVVLSVQEEDYEVATHPGEHTGPNGVVIPTSPFSVLTTMLLSLAVDVVALLEHADAAASSVSSLPSPWWHVAAAMASYGDRFVGIAETLLDELAGSPSEFVADAHLWDPIVKLFDTTDEGTAASRLRRLQHFGDGPLATHAGTLYLRAVLADDAWLMRQEGLPRHPATTALRDIPELDDEVSRRLNDVSRDDDDEALVRVLRLVDFATTEGWSRGMDELPDEVEFLLQKRLVELVLERPEALERLRHLSPSLMTDLVRPIIGEEIGRAAATRIVSASVIQWFYPDGRLPRSTPWSELDLRFAEVLMLEPDPARNGEARQAALSALAQSHDLGVDHGRLLQVAYRDQAVPWAALAELEPASLHSLDSNVVVSSLLETVTPSDLHTSSLLDLLEEVSPRVGSHHVSERSAVTECLRLFADESGLGRSAIGRATTVRNLMGQFGTGRFGIGPLFVGEVRAADTIVAWTTSPILSRPIPRLAETADRGAGDVTLARVRDFIDDALDARRVGGHVVAAALITASALAEGPPDGRVSPTDAALLSSLVDEERGDLVALIASWWSRLDKEDRLAASDALYDRVSALLGPTADESQVEGEARFVVDTIRRHSGQKRGLR